MSETQTIAGVVKTLLDRGQEVAALQALDQHLAQQTTDAAAWRLSGVLAARQRQFDSAIERIRRALALQPRAVWRAELMEVLLLAARFDDVMTEVAAALDADPHSIAARLMHAKALQQTGDGERAIERLREVLSRAPTHSEALQLLVPLLKADNRFDEAQAFLRDALRHDRLQLEARLALSELLCERGLVQAAVENYHDGLTDMPKSVALWLGLAQAYEDGGDKTAAEAAYRTALQIEPSRGFTIGSLLELLGGAADEALLARARSIMAGDRATDVARALVGYGLGKAEAALGRHAEAFAYWRQANGARRRESGAFDRDAMRARVDGLIEVFDTDFFAERSGWGSNDVRPIFVIGMPRSGTTLIEQIIVSHPAAMGYGELPEMPAISALCARAIGAPWPLAARELSNEQWHAFADDYIRRLNARAEIRGERVVDKAPTNFFHVGLIKALFPQSHVVWCRRDPRDVCLSIYSENFGLSQQQATDLGDLGFYFREHERLMRHWQRVLPGQIYEAQYEALIDSPDEQIRALIAAIGLPWDDACMQFHTHERSVQTPSRWQVRKPLYRGSLARWRHYEPWLQPLFDALT